MAKVQLGKENIIIPVGVGQRTTAQPLERTISGKGKRKGKRKCTKKRGTKGSENTSKGKGKFLDEKQPRTGKKTKEKKGRAGRCGTKN